MIYPVRIEQFKVRKPNAIADMVETGKWLFPNGWYTLTRRFSSKEEKRRIVATIHDPSRVSGERIGFENHLNLFHAGKKKLNQANKVVTLLNT